MDLGKPVRKKIVDGDNRPAGEGERQVVVGKMHQASPGAQEAHQQGRLLADAIGALVGDLDSRLAAEHRSQLRHIVGGGKHRQVTRQDAGDGGE